MKKHLRLLCATLLIFCLATGCGGESSSNNRSQTPQVKQDQKQQQTEYIEIGIDKILQDATSNAARANKSYKGKNVKIVGGRLSNIDSDLSYITVESLGGAFEYGLMSVHCDLNSKAIKDKVLNLSNGQPVVLYGSVIEVGDIMGVTINLDNIEPVGASMTQQSHQNAPQTSVQHNQQSIAPVAPKPQSYNTSPAPQQQRRNMTSDLALANVAVGDSFNTVQQVLGTPYKEETKSDGKKYYFYPLVEVHCQNGTVITLISNSNAASTPRGVHEGSSLQDVLSAYGNDYMKSRYENLDLYEYNYTTKNGLSKILRFAINPSGQVDYISIR